MWWLFAHVPTSILFGYTLTKLFIHLILTCRTIVLLCRCVFNDTAVWVLWIQWEKNWDIKNHIVIPTLFGLPCFIPFASRHLCSVFTRSLFLESTMKFATHHETASLSGRRLQALMWPGIAYTVPMWIKNKRYMR